MVVTYLVILTAVTGYACWRGYQLEVWVGELSKTVGQLANNVALFDLQDARIQRLNNEVGQVGKDLQEYKLRLQLDPFEVAAKIGALSGKVDKLERATKKPRGKK